jgi:murein DD-endopeptidase MepM/ murein hydrolase activator NlpD
MLTQNKNRTPHSPHRYFSWTVWALLAALLLASCTPAAESCPQKLRADLSQALSYADNEALPFQYPLPELGLRDTPSPAKFCKGSFGLDPQKFHAAEDYHLPAGTPVYAFADGEISFSGRMGGYGWLIIVDHPQHNIYSLYGHLSPSRWKLESGMEVERGDLIGYLGDDDENGGSAKKPLVTHLHFGIRVGQRADYPGFGEWRWQAGWIKPCPTDLGWLKPSAVIVGQ